MYSIVLLTALTSGAEAPGCHRRAIYYSCTPVYYCQPVVYWNPCVVVPVAPATEEATDTEFTEDDVKELKAAGATVAHFAEFKEKGFGHQRVKDCLAYVKENAAPDTDFTEDDVKELKAAGATAAHFAEFKEKGFGHQRLKACLDYVKGKKVDDDQSRSTTAPGTVIVQVPPSTTLYIDDQATPTSTSERRVFATPTLPVGRQFEYTFKAERTVDGVKQVVTETVAVSSGSNVLLAIDFAKSGVVKK